MFVGKNAETVQELSGFDIDDMFEGCRRWIPMMNAETIDTPSVSLADYADIDVEMIEIQLDDASGSRW